MEFSNTNENICVSRNSELGFPLSNSESSECYFYPAYVNHIWDPSIPHRKKYKEIHLLQFMRLWKGIPIILYPWNYFEKYP